MLAGSGLVEAASAAAGRQPSSLAGTQAPFARHQNPSLSQRHPLQGAPAAVQEAGHAPGGVSNNAAGAATDAVSAAVSPSPTYLSLPLGVQHRLSPAMNDRLVLAAERLGRLRAEAAVRRMAAAATPVPGAQAAGPPAQHRATAGTAGQGASGSTVQAPSSEA